MANTHGAPSATVVISFRVADERRDAYEAWQARITAAAEGFDGYVATEVFPPKVGTQDEWVVVYRFDTPANLGAWVSSNERRDLLAEADAGSLTTDTHEQVIATPSGSRNAVSVVASGRVKPGREREYERWQDGITAAAREFPGFLDSELFRALPGVQQDPVVVFRFASAECLDAWLESDVRKQWLRKAEPLASDSRLQRVGGGLDGWFPSGASGDERVPDWKQAFAVLLALYPTVMLLTMYLSPQLDALPLAVSMFIGNVVSVALLTWPLMPAANRVLGPWLKPRTRSATVVGTLALFLGYAAMVWGFLAVT